MGDITLKKALDEYKTVYMPYRNFAERTRVEYQNDLEHFIEFVEKSGINHVKELGNLTVERYVARLEQRGFASLTRKRKVVVIRSFLLFLYQGKYLDMNIAKNIVLPFAESTIPNILTQAECDRLRNCCADKPRDRAIIELLLQTGIKLSELTRLTVDDIELYEAEETRGKQNGFMRILSSRGKKERMIPLNTATSSTLKKYLDVRKGDESKVIFLNRFGESLGERGVQKTLRGYLKNAGIERASIQTLRHTFGFHKIANGTEPRAVQEMMGLKDSSSIAMYVSALRR